MTDKLFYTEEELPQRSEEWLKMRESCIGGSDMATVLGMMEKYTKAETLFKRKIGKLKPKESNAAMERGSLMEKPAGEIIKLHLEEVEGIKNPKLTQFFAKHPEYEYLGVSFDGVDVENQFITEIKCPQYVWNFKNVFTDGIQDYYYPQVQLQLAVAHKIWGIDKAYFCSYFPDGAYILDTLNYIEKLKYLAVIDIEYDEDYFNAMLEVSKFFWECVQNKKWNQKEYREKVLEFRKYGK